MPLLLLEDCLRCFNYLLETRDCTLLTCCVRQKFCHKVEKTKVARNCLKWRENCSKIISKFFDQICFNLCLKKNCQKMEEEKKVERNCLKLRENRLKMFNSMNEMNIARTIPRCVPQSGNVCIYHCLLLDYPLPVPCYVLQQTLISQNRADSARSR